MKLHRTPTNKSMLLHSHPQSNIVNVLHGVGIGV